MSAFALLLLVFCSLKKKKETLLREKKKKKEAMLESHILLWVFHDQETSFQSSDFQADSLEISKVLFWNKAQTLLNDSEY